MTLQQAELVYNEHRSRHGKQAGEDEAQRALGNARYETGAEHGTGKPSRKRKGRDA